MQIDPSKMMKKLWGDNFYSKKDKKWLKEQLPGYERGFVEYIMDPIKRIFDFTMKKPKDQALELVGKLGIKLTSEEKENQEKALMKVCVN